MTSGSIRRRKLRTSRICKKREHADGRADRRRHLRSLSIIFAGFSQGCKQENSSGAHPQTQLVIFKNYIYPLDMLNFAEIYDILNQR